MDSPHHRGLASGIGWGGPARLENPHCCRLLCNRDSLADTTRDASCGEHSHSACVSGKDIPRDTYPEGQNHHVLDKAVPWADIVTPWEDSQRR